MLPHLIIGNSLFDIGYSGEVTRRVRAWVRDRKVTLWGQVSDLPVNGVSDSVDWLRGDADSMGQRPIQPADQRSAPQGYFTVTHH
jgi:hypothetical protein